MRLSIISNCQKDSLATCIAALNHGFQIDTHMIHELMADTQLLRSVLEDSAFVFAHLPLRSVVPADLAHKVTYFPNIAFSAYHPDLTFARARKPGGDVETVFGPLHVYNSAIAVFGYREGIPLEEILTFYSPNAYARLGYFDQWEESRRQLLIEGEACGMPLGALIEKWSRGQAFMYSSNHPTLAVMEDIARELLQRIGMFYFQESKHELLTDPLKAQPIWPIYPEIAERLGLRGSTAFKVNDPHGALELRDFVRYSYESFANYDRKTLESLTVDVSDFAKKLGLIGGREAKAIVSGNPYAGADKVQFWRNSVANVAPEELDPVVDPKFNITPYDKVATAGSCFAQHIARTLKASGFDYFVPEAAPHDMDEQEAKARNYGVFSARFGNIYTVRQLLQLIERVEGKYNPSESAWPGRNGGLVDPFRPQIEPEGYVDELALDLSRQTHFDAVRQMLREMSVFVFTLGLTEGWRSKTDGAVFPLAPGVAGGAMDEGKYEFINFDVDSVRQDLHEVIAHLKRINPSCKIILTVSPVPLIATFEHRHALVSTTYSKAVLRVVADEMWRRYDHVDYFPSYEIITGAYNRGSYYADDLREVREEGVAHVMRIFMRHYTGDGETSAAEVVETLEKAAPISRNALFDIVCDEEAIVNF